jgi:hydroxyethylthiazole kinase-like uncharacterized protein yjeF
MSRVRTDSFNIGSLLQVDRVIPVTIERMRQIEQEADSKGISRILMMENAGGAIAEFIFQNVSNFKQTDNSGLTNVLFIAGIGNNGGDAFVAARHLGYWKEYFKVTVLIVGDTQDIRTTEARLNFESLKEIVSIQMSTISSSKGVDDFALQLSKADVAVVGIFGTGFTGEPRSLQKEIIETLNQNTNPVKISVDVPSGLEASSGNFVIALKSDFTITMHAPKIGMLKNEKTLDLCGRILVANIGVPT